MKKFNVDFPRRIYLREDESAGLSLEILPKWFKTYKTCNDELYIRKAFIESEISELIKALEKQNPDPLGNDMQCLAAAEIETLKIVLEIINKKA